MKNKMIAILVTIIVLGALGWWYQSLTLSKNHSGHEHKKEEAQYICPMHPQITSDRPGACPICGMDLVPVSEMEEEEEENPMVSEEESSNSAKEKEIKTQPEDSAPSGRASVKLSLDKKQMIGVKLEEVEKKKLFKDIKAPARIAFDPELYTAQSEFLEALKQWRRVKNSPIPSVKENTKQMIQSSKIRLRVLGLSDDQIEALTKKGSQSESLLVGGGENMVYADVFEVDLPYIKEGQSAQITARFLQGKELPAKVISVDRVINPETRTAKVRIELLKNDTAIRPESYVNATIFAPMGERLAVPLESIMDTGLETYVFVKKAKGKFEPRNINILFETATEAAISGPIHAGEEVVVGANFLIDSESRLRSVIQKSGDTNSEHNH